MNLFRSEEHVERWLPAAAGATIPIAQLAVLASAWWGDRLSPGLAPAHAGAEPGDPGRRRADRRLLAPALAQSCSVRRTAFRCRSEDAARSRNAIGSSPGSRTVLPTEAPR